MQASHLRRKLGDTAGCEVLAKILAAQGGVQEGLEHSPIEVRIDAVEVRRLEPGHKLLQRLIGEANMLIGSENTLLLPLLNCCFKSAEKIGELGGVNGW